MTDKSRRNFMKASVALGATAAIAGVPGIRASNRQLIVVSWGGGYQDAQRKAWFEPFQKETGVEIIETSPTNYGKIKSMVTSGNTQWDVVDVDSDWAYRAAKQDLLTPLNYDKIETADVESDVIGEHNVGNMYWAEVIAYNTDRYAKSDAPTTWKDVWDIEGFPGPRSLENMGPRMLPIALLADGADPADLYPLDLDRAFASLDRIRPEVVKWFTTGSESANLLATGQSAIGSAWSGRIASAAEQGRPVAMNFNQGLLVGDSWVVPKGAPNADVAMDFINFTLQPEQQAALSRNIPYGPTNTAALELLDAKTRATLASSGDNLDRVVPLDARWTAENYQEVSDRWHKWMVG
jgi:putative spermidine/putrescine transport system substrate-binding protein